MNSLKCYLLYVPLVFLFVLCGCDSGIKGGNKLSGDKLTQRLVQLQQEMSAYGQKQDSAGFYAVTDTLMQVCEQHKMMHEYYLSMDNLIAFEVNRGRYFFAMQNLKRMEKDMHDRHSSEFMAQHFMSMATLYTARDNHKMALKFLLKAQQLNGDQTDVNLSFRLADCYILLKQYPKAVVCLDSAYNHAEMDMMKANVFFYKARAYYFMKDQADFKIQVDSLQNIRNHNQDQSFDYFFNFVDYYQAMFNADYAVALKCAQKMGDEGRDYQVYVYESMGNPKKALEVYRNNNDVRDSVRNVVMQDELLDMAQNMDNLQLSQDKLKAERNSLITLIVFGGLLVITALLYLRSRRMFITTLKKKNEENDDILQRLSGSENVRRAIIKDLEKNLKSPLRIIYDYVKIFNKANFNMSQQEKENASKNMQQCLNVICQELPLLLSLYTDSKFKDDVERMRMDIMNSINAMNGYLQIANSNDYGMDLDQKIELLRGINDAAGTVAYDVKELILYAYYGSETELDMNDEMHLNEFVNTSISNFDFNVMKEAVITTEYTADEIVICNNYAAMNSMFESILMHMDQEVEPQGEIQIITVRKNSFIITQLTYDGVRDEIKIYRDFMHHIMSLLGGGFEIKMVDNKTIVKLWVKDNQTDKNLDK